MALHLTLYAGLGVGPGSSDPEARGNFSGTSKRTYEHGQLLKSILKDSGLPGYSIVEGSGFYKDNVEPCMIVSVICAEAAESRGVESTLKAVAEQYKELALQEEVWITRRIEDLIIV